MPLSAEGRAASGRLAGLSRRPDENAEEIERVRQELRGYSAEAAAQKLVADWAPLSDDVIERIVTVFRGAAK